LIARHHGNPVIKGIKAQDNGNQENLDQLSHHLIEVIKNNKITADYEKN